MIRSPQGRGVLLLGASDYDDQALRALDLPRTVVLVHWDNFETPLVNPPRADARTRARMRAVSAEVKRESPRTRVLVPSYQAPMELL